MFFEKYIQLDIDFASLGLERRSEKSDYFCTPKGAKVFGWAGVDGIHFCIIEDLDGMVFAVNPMGGQGDYVHPVAISFKDFLMLLVTCGHVAPIEQAHAWDRKTFEKFLKDDRPSEKQLVAINTIKEELNISPMDDPYGYICEIEKSFNYATLKYKPDYEEWAPKIPIEILENKVYFNGGFTKGEGRPGKRINIEKDFIWNNEKWHIPAVYVCAKGLVVDIVAEINRDKLKKFIDICLEAENSETDIPHCKREAIEQQSPIVDFKTSVTVNGRRLCQQTSCREQWIPEEMLPESFSNDITARWLLRTYGLDTKKAWLIQRVSLPWATASKPKIKTLSISLEQQPIWKKAEEFTTPNERGTISFTDPNTGIIHTLEITDFEKQDISQINSGEGEFTLPTHCHVISYTVTPPIDRKNLIVRDTEDSDQPIKRAVTPKEISPEAAAIGIIGGADGPVAVFATPRKKKHFEPTAKNDVAVMMLRGATSSLHFEQRDSVTWQIQVKTKQREDISISLI